MKRDLGSKNWVFPMSVLIIGTYGEDEIDNCAVAESAIEAELAK